MKCEHPSIRPARTLALAAAVLILGAAAAPLSAADANTLKSIDVRPLAGQQLQLTLHLTAPAPQPLSFTIDNPARISIDLPHTALAPSGQPIWQEAATRSARALLRLAQLGIGTRNILTDAAIRNAMILHAAFQERDARLPGGNRPRDRDLRLTETPCRDLPQDESDRAICGQQEGELQSPCPVCRAGHRQHPGPPFHRRSVHVFSPAFPVVRPR